ncbi:4326_t:CDS:2 [Ambispora gerdemannii]|uniref:4326_t:CDS:1 n=1 Tax=Ambispora gerdemannii TaxID=144530 RepID=A0A9N9GKG3_9GLOM|nr:4326_t:CDS:2 [Ambispora gerdemannii]
MPSTRITEKTLRESNKEENNINDIIHTVAATEHSNSKVEHISDALQIKVDYLDVGNLIEYEIRELTVGESIDGIADISYKTHLLVHSDIVITQNKTAKEMADLIITEVEGEDDYSWNFQNANILRKFRNAVGHFLYICCQSKEVNIYHKSLHSHPNLCIEMPDELWEEIKTHSHLTVVDLKNHLRH